MATEYRERVSVKKEILSKIQTLIQFECYEQAIEVLDDLKHHWHRFFRIDDVLDCCQQQRE